VKIPLLLVAGGLAFLTQDGPFDPSTLRPFTECAVFMQKYETGLYPGGKNDMPAPHRQAGERLAAALQPLDIDGTPSPQGKILALTVGHSNCNMYFGALQKRLQQNTSELRPCVELLNGAVGGQQLPEIVQLQGKVWDRQKKLLEAPGCSARQVQVVFFHTTYHTWKNTAQAAPRPFPQTMQAMQADLAKVLRHLVGLYPNLKIAYLTADGFRHFTGWEPHVWQEAFAIKWLIESQIRGEAGTAFEGADRALPWLEWGPYIWDNTWGRDYFTDGVHPAPKALDIFVDKYWAHFASDSVSRAWLLAKTSTK
jgi:hypothetical protein